MKSFVSSSVFLGFMCLVASPANADTFVGFFDQCVPTFMVANAPPGVSPVSLVEPRWCPASPNSVSFTSNGGAVDVLVNGSYSYIGAFGFNFTGPIGGLNISNLTPGYSIGETDVTGTFGTFSQFIYGPIGSSIPVGVAFPALQFTLTTDSGFLSPFELFAGNEFGFLAGMGVTSLQGVSTFQFASEVEPLATVPEPGSMLLLGTGLAAAWRARRRRA